jgi:hypothetical protein
MANLNDFARRFRIGLPSATPFASLGLEWCPRCKAEVDTDTDARHQGRTYSFKRWCLRCGHVVNSGVYHNVPILSDIPLPAGTMEWVTKPGVDRR